MLRVRVPLAALIGGFMGKTHPLWFNKEQYVKRLERDQGNHLDWISCKKCILEYDPFYCAFGEINWNDHVVLICPKCKIMIANMSLNRNSPFIVYNCI
jgi:hypothetical protein